MNWEIDKISISECALFSNLHLIMPGKLISTITYLKPNSKVKVFFTFCWFLPMKRNLFYNVSNYENCNCGHTYHKYHYDYLFAMTMNICNSAKELYLHTRNRGFIWWTFRARIKVSDCRSFILISGWILAYATLIMWMKFSLYWNFCKAEKTKSQSTVSKILAKSKILQKGFYSIYLAHQLYLG